MRHRTSRCHRESHGCCHDDGVQISPARPTSMRPTTIHLTMRFAAIVVASLLLAAGCSADDGGAETTGARAVDGPTTITAVTVINTPFGQVLADGFGYALYTLDGDNSLCTDSCLVTWPPALADEPGPGEGVDASLIGTIGRPEGSQLTLGSRPAYRFSGDSRPGETQGCATAGRWWLVAVDGTRVTHCVP